MKKCNGCKKEKEEADFNKNRRTKDGLHSQCRDCNTKWRKKYFSTPQGKKAEARRIAIYAREYTWRARGITFTAKEYDKKLKEQKGCCAICGRHESEFKNRLSVDHNHITGKTRDLLCVHCNVAVGIVESDKYSKVIHYLDRWDDV